ncbi:uncharacterized protein LOC114357911 [Ostrinia furnacalis]|uniref:uncharacterized protein LOC114357911 n=1 Tax=Ostrinia furnacalis TaxID=93504 RepID=UPI001039BF14|nr:uncharacterized protein LOC114357911 [Ostrinia furnacalis]
MSGAYFFDPESMLSYNEQWKKLEEKWGKPIDLDTEDLEDLTPSKLKPVFSSLDLRRSTFDSSFIMKTVRKKLGRQLSKKSSNIDYKKFIRELHDDIPEDAPKKQFYYISGQILSAFSVEEICEKIDDIFKSVEKLCSATSTIRHRKKPLPEVVHCSMSVDGLSFDDTEDSQREKRDSDDVDRYIDEAFEQLNSTIASVANGDVEFDDATRDSVTTLVHKFTSVLNNPVKCSPRRKRQCNERFRDLADFWKNRISVVEE